MFREITIDEPLEKIMDDWDFLDEKIVAKFTMFKTVGQNIYGVRRRDIGATAILDPKKGDISDSLELGPNGVVSFLFRPLHVHVTTAGTPHRVPHSMGFWHINDMDELYLPLPNPRGEALGHFVVIMQTPRGNEGESVAWYCDKCLTLLYEAFHRTGEFGLEGVFKSSARAIAAYNADPKLRTCPECGHRNPLAYAWNPAKDTPEQRAARGLVGAPMQAEIAVDRPIEKIVEDWDFLDEAIVAKFTMFRTIGQNVFGIRRHAISDTGIFDMTKHAETTLWELGPKGIIAPPFQPMRLHVTVGGTPHRVPHSMGFWHINDMDELYLPLPSAPGDPLGHNVIIMQNPTGRQGESWAWYCDKCLTLLFERHHVTGTLGMDFKMSELAVRDYNSDERHRTCPECGHVNPLGYCWNPAKDTAEERAARAAW